MQKVLLSLWATVKSFYTPSALYTPSLCNNSQCKYVVFPTCRSNISEAAGGKKQNKQEY